MRIGFWIHRENYFYEFGPLIEEATRRGHQVFLIAVKEKGPAKGGKTLKPESFPFLDDPLVKVLQGTPETLEPQIARELIQVVFLIEAPMVLKAYPHEKAVLSRVQTAGTKVVSIPHFYETVTGEPEVYGSFSRVYYHCNSVIGLHKKLLPDELPSFEAFSSRMKPLGSPALDHVRQQLDRREDLRKKYAIPPGKKVVLFMSLKLNVPEPWRKYAFGASNRFSGFLKALFRGQFKVAIQALTGTTYREFYRNLVAFCERNNAVLVVKSRKKNADPEYLKSASGGYVSDESGYPHASAELMAISDLCVHFQSATVFESVHAQVPSLIAEISQAHIEKRLPRWRPMLQGKDKAHAIFKSFPGVVTARPVSQLAEALTHWSLDDFKGTREQFDAYAEAFSMPLDHSASCAILDDVETLL